MSENSEESNSCWGKKNEARKFLRVWKYKSLYTSQEYLSQSTLNKHIRKLCFQLKFASI